MSKYLELVEVSEGVIVLRRSDNKNSPLVKIEFSEEVKKLLNGMEFDVAKEMIKSGIESLNADINLDNLDEDLFENIFKKFLRLSSSSSEIILAEISKYILSNIYFESLESNS